MSRKILLILFLITLKTANIKIKSENKTLLFNIMG